MTALPLTRSASLFSQAHLYLDQRVAVAGWLTSARIGKRVAFLVLSDGSWQAPTQIVVPETLLIAQPEIRGLGAGCAVRVEGLWIASPATGQPFELQAQSVEIVGTVADPATYPIQPKEHSAEFLRSVPHLRVRTAQFGAISRLRHQLARFIHDYFDDRGFVWVATPILTSTDAEGAGDRFQVTTQGQGEFFGRETFLTVSGQLEGEAMCSALSRIYTFGPTFRAEGSHTSRHLAEFWMVEPEMAFASLADLIQLGQGLLQHVVARCLEKLPDEMAYFASQGGRSVSDWEQFTQIPFMVMPYTEAIERLSSQSELPPVAWGQDLHSDHEKWLVAQAQRPVVVVDYPAQIKSFYMKPSADGRCVEAMDILVPGMGEIIGGSVREERLEPLVERMKALGMDPSQYGQYLDLRRYGSVPHGGFGLGFERLVAYVAGLPSIKDAIAYPKTAI
jgi:asparaginyl-tRNA synthetase